MTAFSLDPSSQTPLYRQLVSAISQQIENGILLPNEKLPPVRKLSVDLHVNPSTVVTAYKELERKSLVYTRLGSGTFVSPVPVDVIPPLVVAENIVHFTQPEAAPSAILFTQTAMPAALFPVDAFKEAFDHILDTEKGGAFRYLDSRGYAPLRSTLCTYLLDYGIQAGPDQIQILSGAQQGIDILAKALLQYGDVIFVERPTFYGAAGAFLARGGKLIEIPMQSDGMDMEILEDFMKIYRPAMIYVMAYFQTPTGISYSLKKKRQLLALAQAYDAYIIEDDNLYDFCYTKERVVPLKALDYQNRVIYIKSFSKILMPGLRIGFMVVPPKLLERVQQAKYTADLSTSGFLQKALDFYLRKYGWREHTEKLRHFGRQKYHRCLRAAEKYLGSRVQYLLPNGGISLWMQLPEGIGETALIEALQKKEVLVTPGSRFFMGEADDRHIRLSFCAVSEARIDVGMKRLAECLDVLCIEKKDSE